MICKEEISRMVAEVAGVDLPCEVPPDISLGDYAFPCFLLAKEWKKSPSQIAHELSRKFRMNELIRVVEANGPYLNVFVHRGYFAKRVLELISQEKETYGRGRGKERIVIEGPAPNTNKPLHLGHLRNIALTRSVALILQFSGHAVRMVDLINDRGVHICQSMLAYKKFGKGELPTGKSDHFVGKYYVLFGKKIREDPSLEQEAQLMLQAWEAGDKEVLSLWETMNTWAIDGFLETYARLGLEHDVVYRESEVYMQGKEIVLKGLSDGLFIEEEGAVIVSLEERKLPNKVLIRSDGTSIYITQDIYLAQLKVKEFRADRSIYVVANEQKLHFQQLFAILEILGYTWAPACFHLSYGLVHLPDGRMKSREGTVVDADEIMDEVESLACAEIVKRHTLSKDMLLERKRSIGIGALLFYLLRTDPARDMTYNPSESVQFEGETGPYVQYAHARICSIFRKGKLVHNVDYEALELLEEHEMVVKLSQFSAVVEEAALHCKPSVIARYLLDISQLFNRYYHSVPVLSASKRHRDSRLQLLFGIGQVLRTGLGLLGIDAPEAM